MVMDLLSQFTNVKNKTIDSCIFVHTSKLKIQNHARKLINYSSIILCHQMVMNVLLIFNFHFQSIQMY